MGMWMKGAQTSRSGILEEDEAERRREYEIESSGSGCTRVKGQCRCDATRRRTSGSSSCTSSLTILSPTLDLIESRHRLPRVRNLSREEEQGMAVHGAHLIYYNDLPGPDMNILKL
ncbi:unnamed protein product [Pleuronectes platessa]|uniref:Uncharacterized protein n=1 Tax=Pleuronectes platessa TaxID=8262 RepID=A0A9N7TH92_PLEPL|nr:unnamed protein product [Pleuronectes platessa]